MANVNGKILTAAEERELLRPIEEYVGKIQAEVDALRADGTDRALSLQNEIDGIKRDRSLTKGERVSRIAKARAELERARETEAKNKDAVSRLIVEAQEYLAAHYDKEYYQPVRESCEREKAAARERYPKGSAELEKELQRIKDRRHAAFNHKYHLLDLLRMSKFTLRETGERKWENYRYTFNRRAFLLQNGLYIAILLIFIALCAITPVVKNTPLLTYNNVLNILQQASPRMFLALGVAGLILLTGTDLSIGRMVGMGMTTATIIMHQGINTGSVFGYIFDFTGMPIGVRMVFALFMCVLLPSYGIRR